MATSKNCRTLQARPENRVFVVEADGGQSGRRVKIPAGILAMYGRPRFDYGYVGALQPEMNGRCIPVNHGKMLGGSSSMNLMLNICGAPQDYDDWRDLGCEFLSLPGIAVASIATVPLAPRSAKTSRDGTCRSRTAIASALPAIPALAATRAASPTRGQRARGTGRNVQMTAAIRAGKSPRNRWQ
ncbi:MULTISPECIES: GMC family oxidoreductase N-terminal domain-containing protein [Roseobacteraceae]|uniref:GMC family oxidoreductase N-terminal domain-containing protein n=3 Tax=Roseobacteraceae TaxID=2854170 RepID=UPI000B79F4BB|nr:MULTISPECIES: GMC family oxidoreductase N-terminal domain-containing protein [Roseobacteraceae]